MHGSLIYAVSLFFCVFVSLIWNYDDDDDDDDDVLFGSTNFCWFFCVEFHTNSHHKPFHGTKTNKYFRVHFCKIAIFGCSVLNIPLKALEPISFQLIGDNAMHSTDYCDFNTHLLLPWQLRNDRREWLRWLQRWNKICMKPFSIRIFSWTRNYVSSVTDNRVRCQACGRYSNRRYSNRLLLYDVSAGNT